MKIGTYYYPEQWPREQWKRDLDNIVAMGMQLIHLAEFAWGTIEPSEGRYELDWLDEVLSLAQERGLDVILCTPTAVLPVWLAHQHPDVFFTGNRFGGRRHANHLHPIIRERSVKVAAAMAERFGDHPSVIGWQIDNELSGGAGDQSEYTHAAFRSWLERRYGDIAGLNRAWGCEFWNTYYTEFAQIKFPGSREPLYRNQHETTDGSRFISWGIADYVKLQADVIRPKIGKRWITTNFMPFYPDIDPAECKGSINLWSWDTYPIAGGGRDHQDESFRLAQPDGIAFIHDQMAGLGRWALMEVQPGQINWSGYPARLMPGAVRLLLWQAVAHQAEFITVYRFRQPRFGIEMWHDGLTLWDGVTLSPGGEQFAQVARELKQIAEATGAVNTDDYVPFARDPSVPTIGIVHEHDQLNSYHSHAQAKRWSQTTLVVRYHAAVERLGLHASVTQIDGDWSRFPVLVVPGLQMASDETIAKLYDYVRNGGHLVTTARTGLLDENGQAPEGLYGHRLFELWGATIKGYDALPDETFGAVEFGGRSHQWGVWSELLQPQAAEVVGRFVDQHYAGTAAIVRNTFGKGTVTHVGVVDEGSLADDVIESLARELKYVVTIVPKRVKLHRLVGGVSALLNFGVTTIEAPAGEKATFVIGERTVEAAGVAVWRE